MRVRPRAGCSPGEGGNRLHRTYWADVAVFSKFSLEGNRTSALEILGKKVTPVSAGMAAPEPRFAVTASLCLCVQYLVLMALSRLYTVQSQPELLLFRLAQLYKATRAQCNTA